MSHVVLDDIRKAQGVIKDKVQWTPMSHSRSGSELLGTELYLKYENVQTTGSFKIRGAFNKITSLSEDERRAGIVASSAGNHAQGVAYAASRAGAKAHVVMPETSPLVKVMATKGYGAEVILHGRSYDEAYAHALKLEKEKGWTFVHPYLDPYIIAGQGTIGLEILEQLPQLDSIIVPIGGGGLISGVATAIKALRPECKVYGVVSSLAPGMYNMFKALPASGELSGLTIADGIAVKNTSREMCDNYVRRLVNDIVCVTDDEIAEAIVWFLERAKTVVEGSGATVLAAARKQKLELGKTSCLLLSGGNIDLNIVSMVIERGLSRHGRLARITVVVQDRPGTLQMLTNVIADKRANVMDVRHDRLRADLQISETAIEFLLETKSQDHVNEIVEALKAVGARV